MRERVETAEVAVAAPKQELSAVDGEFWGQVEDMKLEVERAKLMSAFVSSRNSSSRVSSSSALARSGSAAASGSTSTLPFGLLQPPCWDPLASSLSTGARALVLAVYRRMLGESYPWLAGAPVRGFSLHPLKGQPPIPELTFTHFVAWTAPLSRRLKRMWERIQGAFLASATTWGGRIGSAHCLPQGERLWGWRA
jgi:hypothetical protein